MKREDLSDHEHFVKVRKDTWRFQQRHGTIAAVVAIACHSQFSELAVLEDPGFDVPRYAARATGTEDWVHFYQLQPWMYPVIQQLLRAASRYDHIVALVDNAHRFLHDGDPT